MASGLLLVAVLSFFAAYLLAGGSITIGPGEAPSVGPAGAPSSRASSRATGGRGSASGVWDAGSGWLSIPAPAVSFPVLHLDSSQAARAGKDSASLKDFRGQVVLLNFWATWCPPCEREIPELVKLQRELRDRPAGVVGIAVESGRPAEIAEYAKDHSMNYPIWLTDSRTAASRFEAFGLPISLLVDTNGVIRRRYLGPQRFHTLRRDVERLLNDHDR